MELLVQLWLAILASGAAVWVYSALAWMALPHHKNDFRGLPDEAGAMAAIRALQLRPGNYCFPHAGTREEKRSAEFAARWKEGPAGLLNVWGPVNMARNMVLSLVVNLAVSFVVGYLASTSLTRGADFWKVLQLTATAGVLGYTFGSLPNAIWFGSSRNAVLANLFDGVMQGLITGLVFASLWPR